MGRNDDKIGFNLVRFVDGSLVGDARPYEGPTVDAAPPNAPLNLRELGGSQRLSQVRLRPASNECGH